MAAPINPTQLTPPRVALVDSRTGTISREWYRFFLSLLTATQSNEQDATLTPDANTLLASYDAMMAEMAQASAILPDSLSAVANADAKLNDVSQATSVGPPTVTDSNLAVVQAQLQALALAPPPKQYLTPRYGSFYDTTDQVAALANTAYGMTFNSTSLSQGVYIGSTTSRIYVDRANVYNIQFSAQFINTSGGAHDVWVWLAKNGTAVADTATALRIEGNNTQDVAAWNFLLPMNAGDYFELMWEVSDVALSLQQDAATAIHPAIPSIILTVTDNVSSLEV